MVNFRLGGAVGYWAGVAVLTLAPVAAAQTPIDTFADGHPFVQAPPTNGSAIAGSFMVGGERDLQVERISGGGIVSAGVADDLFTFSTGSGTAGEAQITWDGPDGDPAALAATGLGGIDLTAGGANGLFLNVLTATAGSVAIVEVYTSATRSSLYTLLLPEVLAPTSYALSFAAFQTHLGAGANFSSVGAVVVTLRGTDATVVLTGVRADVVGGPAISATKTDAIANDVDADARADVGDTLRYTVTIANAPNASAATGTGMTDTLDPNTALVAGSIQTSPVAIDDYHFSPNPLIIAAPGVLGNDVDADGDPLTVVGGGVPRLTSRGNLVTLNTDGSFSYTPPADGTVDTFNYDVTDGHGITSPGVVTVAHLTISSPTFTSANSATFVAGQAGTFTVTTAGNPPITTLSKTGALPSTVTFTDNGDGTATISGTPGSTTGGTYPLTLTASNGVPPDATQSFTLTVNQAPAITSGNATTFMVGQAGTFTVTTTGFPTGASMSITTAGPLPSGVTLTNNNDGTATLGGTPAAAMGGIYSFTIVANNGVTPNANQSFTLTVNQAPAITSANAATFQVGQAGSFTIQTTGFPTGASMSITTAGPLPSVVTLTNNNDGTATLGGTPAAGTGGIYSFTIVANNGVTPNANQSFTLTVNQPPAITSAATATFAPGKTGQTFNVTTTGFPTNASMVISQTGTLPSGVTFTNNNNGTATIAGTPAAGTQTGSPYTWVVTANNGVSPAATQNPFTFNVTCPVITVSGTIPALTFNTAMAAATFTQAGGNGTIVWSASGLPTPLSINSGNGQVTGTPNVTGTFNSVIITATDAGGCTGTRSLTVTVAPVAGDDTYNGGVDNTQYVVTGGATATPGTPSVQVTGRLVANDFPTGGVTVTAGTFGTFRGGTVVIQTDGTFIYTPKAFPGAAATTSDTFTYTVISNTGGGAAVASAPATVTINLSGRVWYVLNTAGGGGNGQSQSPFNTLAAAQGPGVSIANDTIFVYRGDGTTTNLSTATTLLTGQQLIGEGTALIVNGNTLVNPGSFPLIGNTVTLANTATVSGIDMTTGGSTGISGSGATGVSVNVRNVTTTTGRAVLLSATGGTLSFRSISSNGAVNGISLTNTTGSFTVTGDGASDPANTTRGNTTAKAGGGTITIGSGGTIQNTTAAGVILNNSASVSLTSMNIMNPLPAGQGVNSGNNGITATTVNGLVLDNVHITGFTGNSGLRGTGVTNLVMQHTVIDNNGTASGTEASDNWNVRLDDLAGNCGNGTAGCGWSNSLFFGSRENIVGLNQGITNTTVNTSLTITNSEFRDTTTFASPANDGFGMSAFNNAVTNITATGSTFKNVEVGGFQYSNNDNAGGIVNVRNSIFENTGSDILLAHGGGSGGNSTLNFDISGNMERQTAGNPLSTVAINVFLGGNSGASSLMSGTIKNNTIGNSGVSFSGSQVGDGIDVNATGAGTITATVSGNTVHQIKTQGAFFGEANSGSGKLNLFMHSNSFNVDQNGTATTALQLVGGAVASDTSKLCADVAANTLNGDSTYSGVELDTFGTPGTTGIELVGYGGADNDSAAIASFFNAANASVTPAATAAFIVFGGGDIKGAPNCGVTFP